MNLNCKLKEISAACNEDWIGFIIKKVYKFMHKSTGSEFVYRAISSYLVSSLQNCVHLCFCYIQILLHGVILPLMTRLRSQASGDKKNVTTTLPVNFCETLMLSKSYIEG